jgi:pimeloyl-ACP methyl ester carboxylesterase
VSALQDWWSRGAHVTVTLGGAERQIFTRSIGGGPALTLLHGFPSCSHDWAKVAPALAADHRLLLFDFLGFGASEKPVDHRYSLHEQADLVEALWAREGISSTIILAHDYAVSVTQELLARRARGALEVDIGGVHLLNGGLYPELHRRQPTQTALLDPEQGPQISALLNEQLFVDSLKPTFAESFDAAGDSAEIWQSISHNDGQLISHLLIRYISDREAHRERWIAALERTDVPVAFTWGMLDPISGAHMAQRIRERMPAAPFQALDDVAHWPALEAPARVIDAVRGR